MATANSREDKMEQRERDLLALEAAKSRTAACGRRVYVLRGGGMVVHTTDPAKWRRLVP